MIAVTGGSGFLGKHLVRALQNQKIDFLLLLRTKPVYFDPKIRFRETNFQSEGEIAQVLEGVSDVIHAAGCTNGSVRDLEEANSVLMGKLVEAARRSGVRRILYVSSAAAQFRNGPYGQTKWKAEEILKASGIPYLIFRPTLLYGPGDKKNIALMEKVIARSPFVPLLGDGSFLIQPLYVEDACQAIVESLKAVVTNRTYNLAGPEQISLKGMIQVLSESMGKKPLLIPIPLKPVQIAVRLWASFFPRTRLPVKQILELDQHLAFNIEDAKKDFGFSPRSFQEGVRSMKLSETKCAV